MSTSVRVSGRGGEAVGFVELTAGDLGGDRMIVAHSFNEPRIFERIRRGVGELAQESPGYDAAHERPTTKVQPNPAERVTVGVEDGADVEGEIHVVHEP